MWNAWVSAEELEAWYHPTQFAGLKDGTASELEIGGLWSCGVDVAVHNFVAYFYGQYTRIIEHELLEHTMHYTESAEEFAVKDMTTLSHRIVVEFEDRGMSSWVKFSQYGELPEGDEKRAQAGMESYFDSLGQHLSQSD